MKNILLDTDFGPDCDDVAALAMLHLYANQGLCNLLGIGHCTSSIYGPGAIDAVNRYYGRPDIPIGIFEKEGFLDFADCHKFDRYLAENFPHRFRGSRPESAVAMYRKVLSAQPDGSVTFVAIGPLNNLSALLDSPPDAFSALNGIELIRKKVTQLVLMAGAFPCDDPAVQKKVLTNFGNEIAAHREFNAVSDLPATRNVMAHWPTPKIFLGFEAGIVETCGPLQRTLPEDHPLRTAYRLYTKNGDRYSWDLLTVEFAVDPDCGHFKTSPLGTVDFDEAGHTLWQENSQGHDVFIQWAVPETVIAADINAFLQQ